MRPQRSPKTTRQGGGDSHDTKLPSSGVLWFDIPGQYRIVKSPVVALRLYRITARKRRGRYAESAHRILKDKTFKGNGPSTWRAHRRGTISSYQYELKTYMLQVLRLQSSVSHAAPSTRHESGGTHALQLADSIRKDACFVKIVAPLMLHAHAGDSSQCHELLRGVRANGARRRGGAARSRAYGRATWAHTEIIRSLHAVC